MRTLRNYVECIKKNFFIFIFNILQKHLKYGRTDQRLLSTITLIEHYNALNRIDLKWSVNISTGKPKRPSYSTANKRIVLAHKNYESY